MRRVLFLVLTATTVALTACPSPKKGECTTSKDCEGQAEFGKVCVQGKCAECAADADCKAGFTCQASKCEPKPAPAPVAPACTSDAQCPNGICQAGACRAPECTGVAGECGTGKACEAGRCAVVKVDPACADAAAFTVHFGFDQASLDGAATATLGKLGECLRKAPARTIRVDGHCDSRGTIEYNMALGLKRAEAVKKYLSDLGVAAGVETNTFGKEKPLCREENEGCWSRNRRAEFTIER